MRKKGFKGRCEKRKISKCKEVCRTYGVIQFRYADILQAREDVAENRCNVPLDGCDYASLPDHPLKEQWQIQKMLSSDIWHLKSCIGVVFVWENFGRCHLLILIEKQNYLYHL